MTSDWILVLAVVTTIASVKSSQLYAYNCEHEDAVTFPLDINDVEPCKPPVPKYTEPEEASIKIVQSGDKASDIVLQCKLEETFIVTYCGPQSGNYGTQTTKFMSTKQFHGSSCRDIFRDNKIKIVQKDIKLKTLNPEDSGIVDVGSFFSHGWADGSGYCDYYKGNHPNPYHFKSGGKEFFKSYQQVQWKLTRIRVPAVVDRAANTISMPMLKLTAPYSDEYAFTEDAGVLTWQAKEANCISSMSLLYSGKAQIRRYIGDDSDQSALPVNSMAFINDTQAHQWAMVKLTRKVAKCGLTCYETHMGPAYMCLDDGDPELDHLHHNPVFNSDLVDTNFRIAYATYHQSSLVQAALMKIDLKVCENERATKINDLQSLADGNKFAVDEHFPQGIRVESAGSSAYVTKCKKTPVTVAKVPNCTLELAVNVTSEDGISTVMYADSRSMILQRMPSIVPCSSLKPVRHKIGSAWFCHTQDGLIPCTAPVKLNITGEPVDFDAFAADPGRGLITPEMRRQSAAFTNALTSIKPYQTSQVTGNMQYDSDTGVYMPVVLDPGSLQDKLQEKLYSIVPFYFLVGEWYQGLLAGFIIFNIIKVVAGCIIRMCYAYATKGCGWWVVASVWGTLFAVIRIPWTVLASAATAINSHQPDPYVDGRAKLDRTLRRKGDQDLELGAVDRDRLSGPDGRTPPPAYYEPPRPAEPSAPIYATVQKGPMQRTGFRDMPRPKIRMRDRLLKMIPIEDEHAAELSRHGKPAETVTVIGDSDSEPDTPIVRGAVAPPTVKAKERTAFGEKDLPVEEVVGEFAAAEAAKRHEALAAEMAKKDEEALRRHREAARALLAYKPAATSASGASAPLSPPAASASGAPSASATTAATAAAPIHSPPHPPYYIPQPGANTQPPTSSGSSSAGFGHQRAAGSSASHYKPT